MTFATSLGIVGGVNEEKVHSLGEWLRQRREELGISLAQAEIDTRIRIYYLEALETDQFANLPDPAVGRGFLRNYASYLGLDAQEAVRRFSELVAPPEPEFRAVEEPSPLSAASFRPVPLHAMPGRRRGWLWVVGLLTCVVAVVGFLLWRNYPYLSGWFFRQAPTVTLTPTQATVGPIPATATQTPTALATRPTVAPTPSTLEPTLPPTFTPSPSPTPSPPVYVGIFVELVVTETSWIQVTVDGVRQFQGQLEPPTYQSWYGEERIELRIGNAGGVLVTVNGEPLGTLGGRGEVVDRVFEKVGEQISEATPTLAVTGTVTLEPTRAPTSTTAPTPTMAPTQPVTATIAATATAGP